MNDTMTASVIFIEFLQRINKIQVKRKNMLRAIHEGEYESCSLNGFELLKGFCTAPLPREWPLPC